LVFLNIASFILCASGDFQDLTLDCVEDILLPRFHDGEKIP
jgi:hypothetical protein